MIGRALKLAAVIETVGVLVVSLSQRGVLSRLGLLTNVRKGNGCCGDRSQGDSMRLSAVTALGLRCVEGGRCSPSLATAPTGKPAGESLAPRWQWCLSLHREPPWGPPSSLGPATRGHGALVQVGACWRPAASQGLCSQEDRSA